MESDRNDIIHYNSYDFLKIKNHVDLSQLKITKLEAKFPDL
jgi:hypothetical protein